MENRIEKRIELKGNHQAQFIQTVCPVKQFRRQCPKFSNRQISPPGKSVPPCRATLAVAYLYVKET